MSHASSKRQSTTTRAPRRWYPSSTSHAMNSLAYISRQFDVLASAKTPPSTPTAKRPPNRNGSEPSLQRLSTWSTTSILFPPSPSSTGKAPKRSISFPSIHKLSSSDPVSPSPDPGNQARSESHVENVIRRVFFIRVFALVWDNLHAAWISLSRRESLEEQPVSSKAEVKVREVYPPEVQEKEITAQTSHPAVVSRATYLM